MPGGLGAREQRGARTRAAPARPSAASSTLASIFLPFSSLSIRGTAFSSVWRSASISSVLITSMSSAGSTVPETWITSSSAKTRTTWQIASASRMLARNLLPRPSPSLAPLTMPAMSTNDTVAGTICLLSKISASTSRRGSGSGTTPTFGSIVANG